MSDREQRQAIHALARKQVLRTAACELPVLSLVNRDWCGQAGRKVPQEVRCVLLPVLVAYYCDRPGIECDEGMRSCGFAGMTIMLLSREPGYASTPVDGFDNEAVSRIIGPPQEHAITGRIAIAKGSGESLPGAGRLPLAAV